MLDGRPLGKAGAATRRRLLDATARLLESDGVRDLRVVDIAQEVGTSPATFYQYFRDVEEAVLALNAEVGEELAPVDELLSRRGRARRGSTPPARWSTRSSDTGTGTGRCSARATWPHRKATCGSAKCATTPCGRSPITSRRPSPSHRPRAA